MRRIAVLTSGGDAPGMNAAIRAVVRMGIELGAEVVGVQHGYRGLVEGDMRPLAARDVGGILQHGGTILGSARCPEFREDAGQQRALRNLEAWRVDGLVVIGGNGSQTGSWALGQLGIPVVGVASTIDNDVVGTDITLGVDTALNIALEAIDRIRTTASSHKRAFIIEVMGRDSGYLAMMAGLAGGAEAIVIPEAEISAEEIARVVGDAYRRGKAHGLVVVAEGSKANAAALMQHFEREKEQLGFDMRATILGHVQRGGVPTVQDRLLGARCGAEAVRRLVSGEQGVVVGMCGGQLVGVPLDEVKGQTRAIDVSMLDLAKALAR